jgi:prepilin-type N-terminal cleavage/methylation domain-containing protein
MRRFTLVELMIVVAIVAVLASLGLPAFRFAQLKARAAELPVNVNGAHDAMVAYHSANDKFLNCNLWAPSSAPGKTKRAWSGAEAACYTPLGWAPDGDVYGWYQTGETFAGFGINGLCACNYGPPGTYSYTMGRTDLDADGTHLYQLACVYPVLQADAIMGTTTRTGLCSPPNVY